MRGRRINTGFSLLSLFKKEDNEIIICVSVCPFPH
jgi:hypothetical protein